HVLALKAELFVAPVGGAHGGEDCLVWLGVRAIEAERSVWIVRRIRHRQDHVGRLREILPALADFERAVDARYEAENVSRRAHAFLREARSRRAQELGEDHGFGAIARAREDLRGQALVWFREANVVELHFLESERRRF